jgi:hypothetical protein
MNALKNLMIFIIILMISLALFHPFEYLIAKVELFRMEFWKFLLGM